MKSGLISKLLLVLLLVASTSVQAQQHILTTEDEVKAVPEMELAKDFWFTMIQNYEMQGGKYYDLYITPEANTTVHISAGNNAAVTYPLVRGEVLTFHVPLAWELTSSGVVENKAIHVWADEEINVQLFSRNPATSDGMTIIPVTGWGNEYVVAAFSSYAYLQNYDLPSEFAIVAKEDNTVVTITPKTDLRSVTNDIGFPRNTPFTVTLDRGQCVQYKASDAHGNTKDYDVTGTHISSTKLIGVVAGVECANIPADYPYCDHICDMITPISRWGRTYYSMPFANRVGGDGFVVIAKEDNTTITRTSASGVRTHAVLNKFEHYFRHDITEPSKWTSDKPFLLAQYINSTDYPQQQANNGIGDPSFTMVPQLDQYSVEHLYQAPTITGGLGAFVDYINIIAPASTASTIKIDGSSALLSAPATLGSYVMYKAQIDEGSHVITASEPVGVYGYGYGPYDSYAWPGAIGAIPTPEYDLEAPEVTSIVTNCLEAEVHVAEVEGNSTAELLLTTDSIDNAEVYDVAYDGEDNDSVLYHVRVIDATKSAVAEVSVMDGGGNRRILTHSYKPGLLDVDQNEHLFVVPVGVDTNLTIQIKNSASYDLTGLSASMAVGGDFAVLSMPSALSSDESGEVTLSYTQSSSDALLDTLIIRDGCLSLKVPVRGAATDSVGIEVKSMDFGIVKMADNQLRSFDFRNTGSVAVAIDSIAIYPTGSFALANSVSFPINVGSNSSRSFELRFTPQGLGEQRAKVNIYFEDRHQTFTAVGVGAAQSGVKSDITSVVTLFPNPAKTVLTVTLKNGGSPERAYVRVLDVAGSEVVAKQQAISTRNGDLTFDLDIRALAAGAYFAEIEANGEVVRRKFTVSK
jgi:hypothetical protein